MNYIVSNQPVAQGECIIRRIDALPAGMETTSVDRVESGFIISHSEQGHHHILTGGDVMERVDNIPPGMQKFYAILDDPQQFIQDAANPHGGYELPAGIYEIRISREFNPFLDEARRVSD